MGTPTTAAEQLELAKVYCPEILEKLRKSEQNLSSLKYRARKKLGGIGVHESIKDWSARMRKEIAAELLAEFWEAIRDRGRG